MAANPAELTLHLEHVFSSPRSHVFAMHADPVQLARWWGPNGFTVPSIELDLRVGGTYRIAMQPPDGAPFFLVGEFRQVEPPARLAYTFRWEPPDADDRETIVAISLRDMGDSTELLLDQGPFATRERRAVHQQGWTETLARLHALIAEDRPARP
jgi:uncharacterized protein YndB with AHSA1/START domain